MDEKIKDGLTLKEEQFISHYLETNGNATEAARRSGYSDEGYNVAATLGSRLMKSEAIRGVIKTRIEEGLKKSGLDPAFLIQKTIEVIKQTSIPNTKEFNPHATLKALEMLGRPYNLFSEIEFPSPPKEVIERFVKTMGDVALEFIKDPEQIKAFKEEFRVRFSETKV